jgi:hypothetical protein
MTTVTARMSACRQRDPPAAGMLLSSKHPRSEEQPAAFVELTS